MVDVVRTRVRVQFSAMRSIGDCQLICVRMTARPIPGAPSEKPKDGLSN